MPVIELSDDEAGAVAEALRRAVAGAERGAENAHDYSADSVQNAAYLSRVGRLLRSVLDKIERPRPSAPALEIDPCTYWVMLGPERQTAVLVHRKDERDGLLAIGYSVEWSARLDTREQALAWFETYYRSQFREPPKEI